MGIHRAAIDEALLAFVAADPTYPARVIQCIADESTHPLRLALERAVESLSAEVAAEALDDPKRAFLLARMDPSDARRRVSLDIVTEEISCLLHQRRSEALQQADGRRPPLPYGHKALTGVVPDKELLVSISDFSPARPSLQRGGFAFHLPPTLPAPNSSYWLTSRLLRLSSGAGAKVRLDPFIVCPVEGYRSALYAMITYGRPLDWTRLASLKCEEHAEWAPDGLTALVGVSSTQICWSPRDDGIHFTCEELPDDASARPARYAHAIYAPDKRAFVHADGALRYYLPGQLQERLATHVRRAGKAGVQVKIFRTDGVLAREDWCELIAALFVWNQDVQSYFLGCHHLAA